MGRDIGRGRGRVSGFVSGLGLGVRVGIRSDVRLRHIREIPSRDIGRLLFEHVVP